MRALGSDVEAFRALEDLRGQVAEYRKASDGRPPADLSSMKVPELKLYCFDKEKRGMHRHGRISGVELRPSPENFSAASSTGMPRGQARSHLDGDSGKWLYDPVTGLVVIGCTGTDTKHGHPWNEY